jgi:hypothetical protein
VWVVSQNAFEYPVTGVNVCLQLSDMGHEFAFNTVVFVITSDHFPDGVGIDIARSLLLIEWALTDGIELEIDKSKIYGFAFMIHNCQRLLLWHRGNDEALQP